MGLFPANQYNTLYTWPYDLIIAGIHFKRVLVDAELITPANSRPIRLITASNMKRLVDYDFSEKSILRQK